MSRAATIRHTLREVVERQLVRVVERHPQLPMPRQVDWARLTIRGYIDEIGASSLRPCDLRSQVIGGVHPDDVVAVADRDGIYLGPSGRDPALSLRCSSHHIRVVTLAHSHVQHDAVTAGLDAAHAALMHHVILRCYREFSPPGLTNVRTRHLRPGDVFVDIGSYRGYLALKAARVVGPTGAVLAFEPDRFSVDLTRAQASLNGLHNLYVSNAAVVEAASENAVKLFIRPGHGTANSTMAEHLGDGEAPDTVDVDAVDIEDVVQSAIQLFADREARLVFSITTNGSEPGIVRKAIPMLQDCGASFCLTIPTLYTTDQTAALAEFSRKAGLDVFSAFPWMCIMSRLPQ